MNHKNHKEVLKALVDPAFEIDSIVMDQFEEIVFNDDGFDSLLKQSKDSFIRELLIATTVRFKKSRESSYSYDLNDSNYAFNASLQVLYYNLLKGLSKHSKLQTNEVKILINTNDDWLISTGFELLNHSETKTGTSLIHRTYRIMRENGVNQRPYSVGESLANSLNKNHQLYDDVMARFKSENLNFRKAILATFSMCKQMPVEAEALILKTIFTSDDGLKNGAVIAASNCKVLRNEAIALLVKELENEHWFIRGNAAGSLGHLKVKNPEIIIKISNLFGDTLGHDWCAQEAAVNALGLIGEPA